MLDLMRKHARSWIIKLALGAIIIVFVFLYGWSEPQNTRDNYVAKVNGTIISADYFNSLYQAERESLKQRYQGKLPKGLLKKLNLEEKLLRRMIDQVLLLQEAQRLGFFVTEADLRNDILGDPRFQTNGAFDERLYNAFLRAVDLSATSYEQSRRQDLLQDQVVNLLTDGIKFDDGEIREFWHYQNDKLELMLLVVKPESVSDKEVEDPKALEAFFGRNQEDYKIPRKYSVDYVVFSWKDLVEKIDVSEEEAKNYYDSNPREFTIPEKIKASHILVKFPQDADDQKLKEIKEKADKIRERIVKGEDFAKVAKEVSEDDATKDKGGELGVFSRGSLNEDLEKAAFELGENVVSEPIKTPLGYHIVMVQEKKPEKTLNFKESKEEIISKLKAEKARSRINIEADDFYERVYRSENLESAAKDFQFELKSAEDVTLDTGIPGMAAGSEVVEELAALSVGEISKLLRVGETFGVFKIKQIFEPRIPSLDEVENQVKRDFLQAKAKEAAIKKADKIIEEIEKSPDKYKEIAESNGLEWETLSPVSRTVGLVPKLGTSPEIQDVLSTISSSAPLYPEPVSVTEGIGLIRLKKLKEADNAEFEKEKEAFQGWITQVRATEYLNSWLKLLRDRSKIEIHDRFL